MKLNGEQKEYLKGKDHSFVVIDGLEYFCKSSDNEVNELVACKLAKIIGINCAEYYLVKLNGIYYYLSYSFNNIGKFKRGSDFIGKSSEDNTLYNIWNAFESEYPDECKELMLDLVKIFIFDIFLLNGDRHSGNYAVVEKDAKHKVYMFDNDETFQSLFRVVLSATYDTHDYVKRPSKIIKKNLAYSTRGNNEILEYFLSSSSKEFCNLVIDFYYKLTPEVVYNTFLKIEQEENIRISNKDYNIKLYRENYELIGNLLEERGFINKVKGR